MGMQRRDEALENVQKALEEQSEAEGPKVYGFAVSCGMKHRIHESNKTSLEAKVDSPPGIMGVGMIR